MATHSSILAWRIPMLRGAGWVTVHGVAESDTTERLYTGMWESLTLEERNFYLAFQSSAPPVQSRKRLPTELHTVSAEKGFPRPNSRIKLQKRRRRGGDEGAGV